MGSRGLASYLCRIPKLIAVREKIIHARWSGEACWIPLGTFDLSVGPENPISDPKPGQILFYPAGVSETEILISYGSARFNSVTGELRGNHFLTIVDGLDRLGWLGREILWHGSEISASRPSAISQDRLQGVKSAL